MNAKILVVEDDERLRTLLLEVLGPEGYQLASVDSAEAAITYLEKEKVDVLLTDVNLPGKSGLEILPVCLQHNPNAYLIVMTGYASVDTAVQAMKLGADDFLCKPIALNDLISAVKIAVQKLAHPATPTFNQNSSTSPIIGKSVVMLNVLEQVNIIAPYKINVLITGETGTGKELIARAIHNLSPRRERTFVKINCAAIPSGLLESELFGHERGAFTGAINQKIGRFELADRGTLFLDEVGDIPLELQPKLLRVLQEHEFERLGSNRTQRVDVRVVAATNGDLSKLVAEKAFRSDLYYRLNVFPIQIPPLRERREDIPLLVRYFVQKFSRRQNKVVQYVPADAMDALVNYAWPGNVRELENLIERAVLLTPGKELRVPLAELRASTANADNSAAGAGIGTFVSAGPSIATLEEAERQHILRALRQTEWRIAGAKGAAALLGMKRTTLQARMRKLGIRRPV